MLSNDYVRELVLKFTYKYSIKKISKFLHISKTNVGVYIYKTKK
jgi:hypothetical protein